MITEKRMSETPGRSLYKPMLSARTYGPLTALTGSLCRQKVAAVRTSVAYTTTDYLHEDEYLVENPKEMRAEIRASFVSQDAQELGPRTAVRLRVLRLLPAVIYLHASRAFLLAALPAYLYLSPQGVVGSLLLQSGTYIASRPFSVSARRYLAAEADNMRLHRSIDRILLSAANLRVWGGLSRLLEKLLLSRSMHLIPARAIVGIKYGEALRQMLPQDEAVRDIVLKLADDYPDSSASLIATCKLLV